MVMINIVDSQVSLMMGKFSLHFFLVKSDHRQPTFYIVTCSLEVSSHCKFAPKKSNPPYQIDLHFSAQPMAIIFQLKFVFVVINVTVMERNSLTDDPIFHKIQTNSVQRVADLASFQTTIVALLKASSNIITRLNTVLIHFRYGVCLKMAFCISLFQKYGNDSMAMVNKFVFHVVYKKLVSKTAIYQSLLGIARLVVYNNDKGWGKLLSCTSSFFPYHVNCYKGIVNHFKKELY